MPAIIVIVSSRDSESRGEFEWIVEIEPSWPVFMACSMSRASGPRTSPTTMRSGRMRSELRTRSRITTAPLPSMFGGRDSRRTTCGCCSLSSAASSIVMMRSSSGMNDDSTFSVVVFPAPVPPETMMFVRPRTQASRNFATAELIVPNSTRSSAWYGSAANFRIVSAGTVEGQRRDDRVDTRAVGQPGVDVGRRLVDATADLADDLVDRATQLLLVVELRAGPEQLAGPLHVDRVPVVDHDLRDLGVADVGLQRAEPQHAVADLPNDQQLLLRGEAVLLLVEQLAQPLVHQAFQLGVGQRRVVEPRAEDLDQALLHPDPDLGDPVLLLGLGQPVCQRHLGCSSPRCSR